MPELPRASNGAASQGVCSVTEEELKEIEVEQAQLVLEEREDSAPTSRGADFIQQDVPKLIAEVRRLRHELRNEERLRKCDHEPQADSLSSTGLSCRKCCQPVRRFAP